MNRNKRNNKSIITKEDGFDKEYNTIDNIQPISLDNAVNSPVTLRGDHTGTHSIADRSSTILKPVE